MKKLIAIILAALLLALPACQSSTPHSPNPSEHDSADQGISEIISEAETESSVKSDEVLTEPDESESAEKQTEKTSENVGEESTPPDRKIIPETQNSGHYSNNINAFYSGSILVCGDYALEYFSSSKSGNSAYADAINAFAKKYPSVKVTALLTPKACAFYSPAGYDNKLESQKDFIKATYDMLDGSVIKADCAGVMEKHVGEYMFYRTDHHWTSLGAYYASEAFCEANGFDCVALEDYTTVISDEYIGSLYTFCEEPKPNCLLSNPDYSVARVPVTAYTLTYENGGQTYTGKAVNTKAASYASMFLNGDQPLTHIITENKNGRKLIVFKESYGNAFVPYMIDYFEEIVAVDFRKETASVASIIEKYGITDALVINNVQSAVSLSKSLAAKLAS